MTAHKLLPHLLYPTTWIALLLALALLLAWRRAGAVARAALAAALVLLCVSANPMVADRLMSALESRYPPQPIAALPVADAIVLLGGGIALPAAPRVMPDLNEAADRIWFAAELYHAGKAPRIVVTGGQVFPQPGLQSEADYHVALLQRMGVPREAILLETRSRNTADNARLSAELLAPLNARRVLLVTSAMHMPRSMLLFEASGLRPVAASCDVLVAPINEPWLRRLLPNARALRVSEDAIREWIGLLYYRARMQWAEP